LLSMTGKRKSRPPKADRSLRQKLPTRFRHSISPPQIIALLAGALEQEVDKRPVARRLMTHPGVGPLTALVFELVIGSPERFRCGKQVTSYVGLVPSEESSGDRRRLGHISKQGNWWKRLRSRSARTRLTPSVSPPSMRRERPRQGSHGPETRGSSALDVAQGMGLLAVEKVRFACGTARK
jgi:transposase